MYAWFIVCINFYLVNLKFRMYVAKRRSCFIPGFIYTPVQWSHFHEVTGLRVIPELKTNTLLCECSKNISGE